MHIVLATPIRCSSDPQRFLLFVMRSVCFKTSVVRCFIALIVLLASAACNPSVTNGNRLICNAPRSRDQHWVFDFETDGRSTCELHKNSLHRAEVPVSEAGHFLCVLRDAPHGRLIAFSEPTDAPAGEKVAINRYDKCVEVTERYYGISRTELETQIVRSWEFIKGRRAAP